MNKNTQDNLQIKLLSECKNRNEYLLYISALEWGLQQPISIQKKDDLISRSKWNDLVEPFHHQVSNLITFCRRLPVSLVADDVGLGKTITAGLIISELVSRGYVDKILIICPKILIPQWAEELDTKFGIKSIEARGSDLLKSKLKLFCGAVLTTYESARLYLSKINEFSYSMLILDEAHKLRNLYGVDKAPEVAVSFRQALEDKMFPYVLMLTATPIHNRLWDIYSLIDLLTIAKGHSNPFGEPHEFRKKYIVGSKKKARKLNPKYKDDFRSIVYSYMSRVRRGDVNLHFPDREVQMYTVEPSNQERCLFKTLAKYLDMFNFYQKSGLLESSVSHPETLLKRIQNMEKKSKDKDGNPSEIITEMRSDIQGVIRKIPRISKIEGLKFLINRIRIQSKGDWRVIIFTKWLATQNVIYDALIKEDICCGIINGETSNENPITLKRFRQDIPDINVIISTEAGSEGINLQVANFLINFDLPWNPMIVEQRIGRVQRLSSTYSKVCIINIVQKNTFEEHIVGRLMEKLQLASSAIGEIESLLEAAQLDKSIDQKICDLVMKSLKGIDIEESTKKIEESISSAKKLLKEEGENINNLLGAGDFRCSENVELPEMPYQKPIYDKTEFIYKFINYHNYKINKDKDNNDYIYYENKKVYLTGSKKSCFENSYRLFERLVGKYKGNHRHCVVDLDDSIDVKIDSTISEWVRKFKSDEYKYKPVLYKIHFDGKAFVKLRTTVAFDSYEAIARIDCNPESHNKTCNVLEDIDTKSLNPKRLPVLLNLIETEASEHAGVVEFKKFYKKRMGIELSNAGDNQRKQEKIVVDFTPSLEMTLESLMGNLYRHVRVDVTYKVQGRYEYSSSLYISPRNSVIIEQPEFKKCAKSKARYPLDCLEKCSISDNFYLKHYLLRSEGNKKYALPEFFKKCGYTGLTVIQNELIKSDLSDKHLLKNIALKSKVSGIVGEPEYFGECIFSKSIVLTKELKISEISNKSYRIDQHNKSDISGREGHESEFVLCSITNMKIALDEGEQCEISNRYVRKGYLVKCRVTGKMVIPSEVLRSSISNKIALKEYIVKSEFSDSLMIIDEGVRSEAGFYCTINEAIPCAWSNELTHPYDLKECSLLHVKIHFKYLTKEKPFKLSVLDKQLKGISHTQDCHNLWDTIVKKAEQSLQLTFKKVESAILSPDKLKLCVTLVTSSYLGLKTRHTGILYSIEKEEFTGFPASFNRKSDTWI